jgi:hypothetical protein
MKPVWAEFPQRLRGANPYAAQFLLMWPGLDRCATIGFRCVVDLP